MECGGGKVNAAKLALAHAGELRGLITEGEVGDGEKLQGALARLFGEKFAKAAKVPATQLEERNATGTENDK